MKNEQEQQLKSCGARARTETGLPGAGKGRIDEVGRSGVYPGSGPWPSGAFEIRTPATFVHGQTDAAGRQVEGGSELIYFQGQTLLGGETPAPSGPVETRPTVEASK
jgi:hypothetical protein